MEKQQERERKEAEEAERAMYEAVEKKTEEMKKSYDKMGARVE